MTRYLLCCVVVCLVLSSRLGAANDNYPYGGRQAGMGNAAVSIYDFWAISHNQAGMAKLSNPTGGFYFENRFLVKEMGLGAAAVAVPTSSGVFGLSLSYFGYSQYHESKVGLAYARSFGDRLSAGVQFNYMYTFVGGTYSSSSGNVGLELGMIYEALPGLNIGAHIFNPTKAKIASVDNLYDEYIPTIIRFGMAYNFSERVIVSLESEKDIDRKPVFKAGIEYQIADRFYVRGGIGTNPTQNAFGFGIHTGSFIIDLSSSFHHVLGYSPQASIIYEM
jgi:hypothetical protein